MKFYITLIAALMITVSCLGICMPALAEEITDTADITEEQMSDQETEQVVYEEVMPAPAEDEAGEITELTAEEPVEVIAVKTAEEPAEEIAAETDKEPAEESMAVPVEEPAQEMIEEPAAEPVEEDETKATENVVQETGSDIEPGTEAEPDLSDKDTDGTEEADLDVNATEEPSEDENDQDLETAEAEDVPETSGKCGENLTWKIEDGGTLVIEGTGYMEDYVSSGAPWFRSAGSITAARIPATLTKIGQNAFEGCTALTDVYYDGTETEKETIWISEGNGQLVNATWHFGSSAIIDGFNKVNGVWGWYSGGNIQTSMTGIAIGTISGVYGGYYIKNGVFTKATGLARLADGSSSRWYFVQNGRYTKATGIARRADRSNKIWYYVQNGVYKKSTGLAKVADGSDSGWYYVANGRFTYATGIARFADGSDTTWYFVQNGVYTPATGIAQTADGSSKRWYYVKEGVLAKATGLTGVADGSDENWYYVKDGIAARITGLVQSVDEEDDKWYYAENGVLTRATGLARKADGSDRTWYYVRSGVFTKETCVAGAASGAGSAMYYVTDGVLDRSFTGTFYAFTIKSGKVTKIKTSGYGWRYVAGDLYYYRKNVGYVEDTVLTIKGTQYIFDYNGKLVKDGVYSPLATSIHAIDKYYERQGNEITRITLHHMAGISTGEDCSIYFCTNGLENSSNYCIGYDGDISCNIVENFGSWTSSNNYNDRRAICIELSDSNASYTRMTGKTIESLIQLCVDLIQRYPSLGGRFDYKEDGTGNITWHSLFADKDCPGEWLLSKLPQIQEEVNRRLGVTEEGSEETTEESETAVN